MLAILIPIYNQELYIAQTLQSIADQEDQNFICYIIDDASTDQTPYIVQKFCRNRSNFRYLRKQNNTGLSDTIKYGVTHIDADYYAMIDGDDLLLPNMTETYNSIIQQYSAQAYEFTTQQGYKQPHRLSAQELITYKKDVKVWRYTLLRWNKVIRKDLFQQILPQYLSGLNYGEDIAFHFIFAQHVQDLVCIPQDNIRYQMQNSQMSIESNAVKAVSFKLVLQICQHLDLPKNTLNIIHAQYKNLTEAKI